MNPIDIRGARGPRRAFESAGIEFIDENGLDHQIRHRQTAARSGNNSGILALIINSSGKPQCDTASPTKPCKGNNGFGNGGGDGSPNGKEDVDR